MRFLSRAALSFVVLVAAASAKTFGQQEPGTMAFTVSMEQAHAHLFHVVLQCKGLKGAMQDFKMPAWTPGYYGILDFEKGVQNFSASDGTAKPLPWEKTTANTWRVESAQAAEITLTYDVLATRPFVATSFVDEKHAYIMPASLFMYAAGQIQHPVTLEIKPNPDWKMIVTGLDLASPDKPHTYAAPDFDVLYDSPIMIGNLDTLPSFEINGIRHSFTGYDMGGNFDHDEFIKDLKAVVEQGIAVIGDIPYTHYDFIAIGPGGGGIEHLNSTSFAFHAAADMRTPKGRNKMLNFLAHEYFHNFNVKRIRPIALGPFDYDNANLTNMLWVSEGFTVYYEPLMLARAGIMTRDEVLEEFRQFMIAYENSPGRLFESATQASFNSWKQGQLRVRNAIGIVKTISYYDKGPVLGLLLDFKIRHETKNKSSLDTVMQTLYKEYYQEKKRGWTDNEFRAVCDKVAGVPLDENFDYASTTKDVDYAKYLAYAGLELEAPKELPKADLRAVVEDVDDQLVVTALETDSAARRAGLLASDAIKALDSQKVDAKTFPQMIAAKKPGDVITLTILRGKENLDVKLPLDPKLERTFRMTVVANPDPLQTEILRDWLRKK